MSVCLPLHVNEFKDIEAQLSSLVVLYKIDVVSILTASLHRHMCCSDTINIICIIFTTTILAAIFQVNFG